jgi:hypothetical protein
MSKRTSSPSPAAPMPEPSSSPSASSGDAGESPGTQTPGAAAPEASPPSGTAAASGPSDTDGATPPAAAPGADVGKPAELGPPAPLDRADLVHALEATQSALIDSTARGQAVYRERNQLVAALARCARALNYPAWLGLHPAEDATWDPAWRNIVFITIPGGQLSWHVHDDELPLFSFLDRAGPAWDGHSTDEKYARLAEWRPEFRR